MKLWPAQVRSADFQEGSVHPGGAQVPEAELAESHRLTSTQHSVLVKSS